MKPETISQIETKRVAIQHVCDAERTREQRNRLGQFATPGTLADEMLQFARYLLGPVPVRFLDPAIGTGSFYSALLREWSVGDIAGASGFEIDPHYGDPCKDLFHGTPLEVNLEDFTSAKPPTKEAGKYNLLICNPPYVRHHHVPASVKARLQMQSMITTGLRLNGLAGLYVHFVTVAHAWLRQGAIAGWLIPSEFMDVNYGRELKQYLLNSVTLLRIHRFDPADVQFTDALVSSAVVWIRNEKPSRQHEVEFTYGGSLTNPKTRGLIPVSRLEAAPKWSGFPGALRKMAEPTSAVLGDFFRVKRGIATGSNEFFIMTLEQAAERGIPRQYLRPILPGVRHLDSDEILGDDDGNPLLARCLYVLDCRIPEAEIQKRHPRFWNYLSSGLDTVAKAYLCSKRTPWYSQEVREPTYFLCTYMARRRSDGRAQRFLFNRSKAIVANAYLMLYPHEQLTRFIGESSDRARRVWQELLRIDAESINSGGRVYGGGLFKVEPKELARIPAAAISELLDQEGLANRTGSQSRLDSDLTAAR